ncbi:MAG: cbb3-type cytochrome oxidase assembly protein CcoS [Cellvibrionales bacterium]|nr:MAG: cbb3-type cytochrome oxidase assembly protein CcoS [Cellvibrionales bacterium]
MESLYVLIPLSFIVVALGIWLFFWAVNNGQYDDLDGEAERILFDEPDSNIKADKANQRVCELPGKNKQGLKASGSKNV